jgi:hypothetical protein
MAGCAAGVIDSFQYYGSGYLLEVGFRIVLCIQVRMIFTRQFTVRSFDRLAVGVGFQP